MIESKSFGSKAFKVINAIILILLAFSCFIRYGIRSAYLFLQKQPLRVVL